MKKTTCALLGFAAGVAGSIALGVTAIKKLCELPGMSHTISKLIKDDIYYLLYGEEHVSRPYSYTNYNRYSSYCRPYSAYVNYSDYPQERLDRIMMHTFKTEKEANAAKDEIIEDLDKYGEINVARVLDILKDGKTVRNYKDTLYGWRASEIEPLEESIKVVEDKTNGYYIWLRYKPAHC